MRILMISHGYPPVISGVTLVLQELARAILAFLDNSEQARRFGATSLRIAAPHAEQRTFDLCHALSERIATDQQVRDHPVPLGYMDWTQ